jgi:hypothetical protein
VHLLASAAAKAAMADRLGYAQAWLTLPLSEIAIVISTYLDT